jgi:hypothetical protein
MAFRAERERLTSYATFEKAVTYCPANVPVQRPDAYPSL